MTEQDLKIQELKAEIVSLKEQLEQKWIPIDDPRKPKYMQKILTTCVSKDGRVFVWEVYYMNDFDDQKYKVLAWQPLPKAYEPPKEENGSSWKEKFMSAFFKGCK